MDNNKWEELEDASRQIVIKFWETEEDRNEGLSEIYKVYGFSKENVKKAIAEAKRIMRLMDYASIEVQDEDNGLTYYFSDGVEEDYPDKLEESREEKEYNPDEDPGFKEYVRTLLKDGAIDDPKYVNSLSEEEFEDLLINTWMKDPEIIEDYKSLNESKEFKTIQDSINDFKDFMETHTDPIGDKIKEIKTRKQKSKEDKKEESQVRDAADSISADDRYSGQQTATMTGMIADRIADLVEEMGDDYSEWLDKDTVREMADEIVTSTMWTDFNTELDTFIKDMIDDKIAWIRRDEPASKYYEPDTELDENKKLNEGLTQSIYDELSRVLTDYENGNADSDDLYNILVKIQNRWEDTITAVTESKIKKEEGYTQVNNMKIKFSKIYNKYQVISPNGSVLEEFDTEKEASDWAKNQKDFLAKKESKSNGYDDDYRGNDYWELNDMYNEESSISKEDLLDELKNRYATQNGIKKAFEEITGEKLEESKDVEYNPDELLEEIMNHVPSDIKYLDDYAYTYKGLFIELRPDTIFTDNTPPEMDFAVFETEEDMNSDYELNIGTDYCPMTPYYRYWESVKLFCDKLIKISDKAVKNEDYTQASNAGAIKVDIMGQTKKKSKKDKEDPALKSLPVQQVLIEGKEDSKYKDLEEAIEKDIYRWLIDNYELDLKDPADQKYDLESYIDEFTSQRLINYNEENDTSLIWYYQIDINQPYGIKITIEEQ